MLIPELIVVLMAIYLGARLGVTYLNPYIGHHNGDIVGKICAETGKSVREVVLERGLLTEAELDDIFSTQNLMFPVYKAKRYTDENEQ